MNDTQPSHINPHDYGIEKLRPGKRKATIAFFFCLAVFVAYFSLITPPGAFVKGTTVTIAEGSSLTQAGEALASAQVIRSVLVFKFFVVLFGGEKKIAPGDYLFDTRPSVVLVAEMIASKNHNLPMVKVTLPEGLTRSEMAKVLSQKLDGFSVETFLKQTEGKEGYLFPDTYFFFPGATTEVVVQTLEDNFLVATKEFKNMNTNQFADMVILASIVEKEAAGDSDRATIAGIFMNRLAKRMPLGADATLSFITGKSSSELTLTDLKIDSPYNTYIHTGLPPAPIANPGLASLKAAAHPAKTPYLFYLHDANGTIHYATTFEEHKKNQTLYLK